MRELSWYIKYSLIVQHLHITSLLEHTQLKNDLEPIMIRDALYTGCGETQQIPNNELMPRSIYDVLTPSSSDL